MNAREFQLEVVRILSEMQNEIVELDRDDYTALNSSGVNKVSLRIELLKEAIEADTKGEG